MCLFDVTFTTACLVPKYLWHAVQNEVMHSCARSLMLYAAATMVGLSMMSRFDSRASRIVCLRLARAFATGLTCQQAEAYVLATWCRRFLVSPSMAKKHAAQPGARLGGSWFSGASGRGHFAGRARALLRSARTRGGPLDAGVGVVLEHLLRHAAGPCSTHAPQHPEGGMSACAHAPYNPLLGPACLGFRPTAYQRGNLGPVKSGIDASRRGTFRIYTYELLPCVRAHNPKASCCCVR